MKKPPYSIASEYTTTTAPAKTKKLTSTQLTPALGQPASLSASQIIKASEIFANFTIQYAPVQTKTD